MGSTLFVAGFCASFFSIWRYPVSAMATDGQDMVQGLKSTHLLTVLWPVWRILWQIRV